MFNVNRNHDVINSAINKRCSKIKAFLLRANKVQSCPSVMRSKNI